MRKAKRNYALEYIRTGLTVMAEALGPSRAAALAAHAGRLVGMQLGPGTARLLGVDGDDPAAAARLLAALASAEGDDARWRSDGVTSAPNAGRDGAGGDRLIYKNKYKYLSWMPVIVIDKPKRLGYLGGMLSLSPA